MSALEAAQGAQRAFVLRNAFQEVASPRQRGLDLPGLGTCTVSRLLLGIRGSSGCVTCCIEHV